MSQTITELSKSELKAIQKREHELLRQTALTLPISPRQITGKPFTARELIMHPSRQQFIEGFNRGYDSDSKIYTNEIDLGELQRVFTALRENGVFTFAPQTEKRTQYYFEEDNKENYNYNKKCEISLENIIHTQYNYQRGDFKEKNESSILIYK